MGLFDNISGALGGIVNSVAPNLVQDMIQKALGGTGLEGVLGQLQSAGLGEQVSSWLGNGANLPVSVDQLKSVISEEQIKEFAGKFGLSTDTIFAQLSEHLPGLVDKLSPNGKLEA